MSYSLTLIALLLLFLFCSLFALYFCAAHISQDYNRLLFKGNDMISMPSILMRLSGWLMAYFFQAASLILLSYSFLNFRLAIQNFQSGYYDTL